MTKKNIDKMNESKANEELRKELNDNKLFATAAKEFGLKYLQGTAPDSAATPRPMSEIGWAIQEPTVKEMFDMVRNSKDFHGGPFDFSAEYFAGDTEKLTSLHEKDVDGYILSLAAEGRIDEARFLDWCVDNNLVDRPWIERNKPDGNTFLVLLTEDEISILDRAVENAISRASHEEDSPGFIGDNARRMRPLYENMKTKLESYLPF